MQDSSTFFVAYSTLSNSVNCKNLGAFESYKVKRNTRVTVKFFAGRKITFIYSHLLKCFNFLSEEIQCTPSSGNRIFDVCFEQQESSDLPIASILPLLWSKRRNKHRCT